MTPALIGGITGCGERKVDSCFSASGRAWRKNERGREKPMYISESDPKEKHLIDIELAQQNLDLNG